MESTTYTQTKLEYQKMNSFKFSINYQIYIFQEIRRQKKEARRPKTQEIEGRRLEDRRLRRQKKEARRQKTQKLEGRRLEDRRLRRQKAEDRRLEKIEARRQKT